MPTIEGIRLKINKYKRIKFAKFRRKKINNDNFTIISNNCWGGMIYESYGLIKQSPTVGLFFMAEDYITFLENFDYCIHARIDFISPFESKHCKNPIIYEDSHFGSYPIGKITINENTNIEIFFLHYKSQNEALDKWTRRCKRVNKNNLYVKFNDQNGCNEDLLDRFSNLDFENKFFFTVRKWKYEDRYKSNIKYYYKCFQFFNHDHILTSNEPYGNNSKCSINTILSKELS